MSRLMSVSLTEDAVRDRRKTVTRRKGWTFLRPGDRLTLCRKVMGRKAGEPLVRLAEVEVVSVSREPLDHIRRAPSQVAKEGFPDWSPDEFIAFFTEHMGGDQWQPLTVIEWRYLDAEAPDPISVNLLDADPEDAEPAIEANSRRLDAEAAARREGRG